MKLIVNNGNLVNENDLDLKFDFDPTQKITLKFTNDISYKQIFLQVTQFVRNNNNDINGRYLEYPKFYLNDNKPKCNNPTKCKQCSDDNDSKGKNNSKKNVVYSICSRKRREIANKLFGESQTKHCMTNSLSTTGKQL